MHAVLYLDDNDYRTPCFQQEETMEMTSERLSKRFTQVMNKEQIRVRLQTRTAQIEGFYHKKADQRVLDSLNSDDTASVTGFSNSITSDTSGNRVVRCTLNAFPAALAVQDSTKSLAATAHLRLTEGSKTAIASEIKLTVKWKATTA